MSLLFGKNYADIKLDSHDLRDLAFAMIKEKYKDKDKDVISLPNVSPLKEVHVMHKEERQGQL